MNSSWFIGSRSLPREIKNGFGVQLAMIKLAQSIIIRIEVASDPKTLAKQVPTYERGQQ
jgi:hypothetical protein